MHSSPDQTRISSPVIAAPPAAMGERWHRFVGAARLRATQLWFSVRRRPQLLFALPIVFAAVVCALFAPLLAPVDPLSQDFSRVLAEPSRGAPFGTDEFGRDMLSRVIWGARLSLGIALVAVAGAAVIGGVVGVTAGFAGGSIDGVLMRVVDALMAFPGLITVIALATALGPSHRAVVIGLAIAFAPTFARLSRALVLRERNREYVVAAVAIGQHPAVMVGRHILPNLMLPLVVQTSLSLGSAMIAEASLSYLGLAAQPNEPSWGRMVLHGRAVLEIAPHVTLVPLVVLAVVTLAFNLLGDGLSDLLDPQLRRAA
jgi:peptide/nickel transport system permease protein